MFNDNYASHLMNLEKLISELHTYSEEINLKEVIGYFQVTLANSYDCVISYFDTFPVADENINNLKARFIEEYN